jgi:hypothetical protein
VRKIVPSLKRSDALKFQAVVLALCAASALEFAVVRAMEWKISNQPPLAVPVRLLKMASGPQFVKPRNAAPFSTMPIDLHRPVPTPPKRSRSKDFEAGKSVAANPPLASNASSPGSTEKGAVSALASDPADNTAEFEVTLNSEGVVVADKILKPSANMLRDVTYQMLLLGQHFSGVSLPPGNTIRKTISITFDNPQVNPLP